MNRQLPLSFALHERFLLERFEPGGNAEAVDRLCSLSSSAGFECVWVWGPPGIGKSHLLQAVCQREHDAVAYLPAAEIEAGDVDLAGYDEFCCVLLDDVDRWLGHRGAEESLFGLYNGLLARNGALAMTATVAPAQATFELCDFASRARAAACYELVPLPDESKAQVLTLAALDRGLTISGEVVEFMMRRTARDLPALLEALDKLDRESMAAQRRITIPFVKRVLGL